MEFKLLVILYLTTLPLNTISIENKKPEDGVANTKKNDSQKISEHTDIFEAKPDPSALVIPGYNLPGPIFNDGKPFYAEKDPLTGQIDFNSKTSSTKDSYLEYDYIEEAPSANIYDKANIDRKDGGYGSHRPNDINQLTPNFHDFLNLPVKYNPDKYVYPLISSSYANTKIQGNVNRYNHKTYEAMTTTKPTASPTYYTKKQSVYYNPKETTEKSIKTSHATTTTPKSTTSQYTTTPKPVPNLLNSAMNHPTTEENYDDYDIFTTKPPVKNTERPVENVQKVEKTTHRPYSIFDELFGDYNEEPKPIKTPSLFGNLGNFGDKINKNQEKDSLSAASNTKTESQTVSSATTHNSHQMPSTNYNNEYDYDDEYYNADLEEKKTPTTPRTPQTVTPGIIKTSTSIVTESSIFQKTTEKVQAVYSNFHQNYNQPQEKQNVTQEKPKTERPELITFTNSDSYEDYDVSEEKTKMTTPISITTPSMRVTSMPLGENHPTGMKMPPIIAMSSHNIKEQLINEKVASKNDVKQENVTYVDDHDNEEEEKDQTFFSNSFRPLYNQQNVVKQPELDEKGEIKEKLTFTGTGQTNSNYSWTVPTKNNYDTYSSYDPVAIKNLYNQEIQSNYSWKVPESNSQTHKKYIPEQNIKFVPEQSQRHPEQNNMKYVPENKYAPLKPNAYKPPQGEFNLQQVSSGYSIGQPIGQGLGQGQKPGSSYSQGQVFNVGLGTNFNGGTTKLRVPQNTNYQFMQIGTNYNMTVVPEGGASVNIQPLRGTEASLSIGSPTGEVKTVPGQVMDEKLDLKDEELRKKVVNKVVFPEDKPSSYNTSPNPSREILSLYSKPMLHQLPADLTPPSEREGGIQQDRNKPQVPIRTARPPWDPRPGHFYQGKPEYARPPRPPMKPDIFKRIDGLPNILPQFRPNAKVGYHHENIPINPGYMQRQPLLERPSNRPIGFFEKLHPPPPPKRILELRKPVTLSQHLMNPMKQLNPMEQRPTKLGEPSTQTPQQNYKNDQYNNFSPPNIPVNRRNGEDESEIATLQMLHAKQADNKLITIKPNVPPPFKINYKEPSTTEKPLYVVYPVNTQPLKLDVLEDNEKETVVIGQRVGENPLPPSKIQQDVAFVAEQQRQNPILKPKDWDAPILKTKPTTYPIKSDFPYPLERPDGPNVFGENKGSDYPKKYLGYQGGNQWGVDTESRIVSGNKISYGNEPISATLKTYTASPIAIAYTPTEPSEIRYSRPNVASSVIPEIRNEKLGEIINGKNKVQQPGVVSTGSSSGSGSEFTVSAVMHTHQQNNNNMMLGTTVRRGDKLENHKREPSIEPEYPPKLEFQAPFQASVNIGGQNNGWSVIREKSKDIDRSDNDVTTINPSDTTTEFDIENFKPQMFGGFKPIFDYPETKEKENHQ